MPNNLSELYLTIGDVTRAITCAEQCVELADRRDDWQMHIVSRTAFADALHQAGSLAKAEVAFHESEEIQKKNQPEFSLLTSLQGCQYCGLLLSQSNYAEVQQRATQPIFRTLKIEYQGGRRNANPPGVKL